MGPFSINSLEATPIWYWGFFEFILYQMD